MKNFILILILILGVSDLRADTNGTPVFFSLRQLTGLPHVTRFALVPDARQNPVTDGSHLFGGFPIVTNAPNGTNTLRLQPIGYTLTVPGWARSLHLVIPDTTNTVNAVNCITNGLQALNSATVLGLQSVAVSNSATVTWTGNGTSTNPLIATASGGGSTSGFTGTITNLADMNITFSTNYSVIVSSAGTGINGTYTWNGTTLWNGYPWYYLAGGSYGYSLRVDAVSGGYAWRIGNAGGPGYIYYQQDGTATPLVTNAFTTLVNGSAPLPVASISNSIITNTGHFNLITFTNGICVTNIVQ